MAIEITSVPDRGRILSWAGVVTSLRLCLRSLPNALPLTNKLTVFRSVSGLFAIAFILGGDSLLRSYKYYSRIVDARLASGYLTSRPGLYAAPRVIKAGQKMSRANLVTALKRAGYVEPQGSVVWSGSFREINSTIEIRPSHTTQSRPSLVTISFEDNTITNLTVDGIAIESFTLEPEILSNDPFSKTGKRETIRYEDIPPFLIQAILSIEDHRFFQHPGLDVFGITRALLRNAGEEPAGSSRQGGSTITQQLVKNTYLSSERTLQRKYSEAMLAFALERRLSKEDILALYCNEVYLGQRGAVAVQGVKDAARVYFGKELKNLTLGEAATIAGMIQSPSHYSPVRKAEAAQMRRNAVLQAMVRDGWILAEQAEPIAREPIVVTAGTNSDDSLAPYFVDFVNRTADSNFAASAASERIYTTIDLDLQQLAHTALARQLERLEAGGKGRASKPQVALVALEPKTGNVLAMVGGRDYAESQLNRATDARRQPGSTFKPFVYAAAIEDGMSPVQMFTDAPRDFIYDRNKSYRPANFGGGYTMRDVTMRTGLVKSLNVVTVDVALQTGLARIANLAQQFGLPRPERYPSMALGTKEVTPLELATAYASFVNGGRRVEAKVITSLGEPPATHFAGDEGSGSQVISPTTAYVITNMLSSVVDHGTARAARGAVKGTAIAGKTGTSRDGWFVGYTPNLVCVVWIGYDDNQQLGLTGAEAALPAWVDFMNAAVELKPELGGRTFECPEGIKFVEIDAETGSLSTLSCPRRELIAVTERLAPHGECFLHGNLPESIGVESVAQSEGPNKPYLAQHARALNRTYQEDNFSPPATRVEVDGRGKRTLVNAMR
jgi:penicillin-binding protein 1B